MKIPAEWAKYLQDQPTVSESIIKPAAYSRYSNDIPGGVLSLIKEYGEYGEYTTDDKISGNKIIINGVNVKKKNISQINKVSDIPDIPHIPAYKFWTPSVGRIGLFVALDTETEVIPEGDRVVIPRLAIATAASRTGCFVIPSEHLRTFLRRHKKAILVLHNAAFDRKVIKQHSGIDLRYWLERGRLLDTFYLYQLLFLAEKGHVPKYPSLAYISEELAGIKLNKDEAVRLGFGQFINPDGSVDIAKIPPTFLKYAAEDAFATFRVSLILLKRIQEVCRYRNVSPSLRLSHDIQVMASFALDEVTRRGMQIEPSKIEALKHTLELRKAELLVELKNEHGWNPGAGSAVKLQELLAQIERETGARIPRTGNGKISSKDEDLHETEHPFVKRYLEFREVEKWLSTFLNRLSERNSVNPHFTVLMRSGRTSCSGPNTQQLPRRTGIREAFIPRPGYYFLSADYRFLELCALASECLSRYKHSMLAEVINSGKDPHRWLAAQILNKPESEVTKEDRSKAKAVAFGFPGGLGAAAFLKYAKANYGLDFTEAEAVELKEKWLTAFPEMRSYMESRQDEIIIDKFNLHNNPLGWPTEYLPGVFRRVISGTPFKASTGEAYPEELVLWLWTAVESADFINKEKFAVEISARKGSKKLVAAIFSTDTVVLKSGRIRHNCSYCQARNTPFQGTAADGAKLALYRLIREGFRVVNFIHDEFIIEVPVEADHLAVARQVEMIMSEEMARMIPDVKIGVEFALMDCWQKGAEAVFDNPGNPVKLLLWRPDRDGADLQLQTGMIL